jgi:hypothetical protein
MEDFYYSAMYDVLQDERDNGDKALALKSLQAKIIRLNSTYYRSMVDNGVKDRFGSEDPSLHHLINERKRQVERERSKGSGQEWFPSDVFVRYTA